MSSAYVRSNTLRALLIGSITGSRSVGSVTASQEVAYEGGTASPLDMRRD